MGAEPAVRMHPVAVDQVVPALDFFRGPALIEPKLNRTGTVIVGIATGRKERDSLFVYDRATERGQVVVNWLQNSISGVEWVDDANILTNLYSGGLFFGPVARLESHICVTRAGAFTLIGLPRNAPTKPIYYDSFEGVMQFSATTRFDDPAGMATQFAGPANTWRNTERRFPPAPEKTIRYLADANGELGFAIVVKAGVKSLYRFRDPRWEKCRIDLDAIEIIGAGDAPGELIVRGPRQGKPRPLQRFDTERGELGEIIYQDEELDLAIGRVLRREADRKIVGLRCMGARPKMVWLQPGFDAAQRAAEKTLQTAAVACRGFDQAERGFLFEVASDRHPGAVYLLERDAERPLFVTNVAPWIDPARMRPREVFAFTNRDGVSLQGVLTLPKTESPARPPPLVVIPARAPAWFSDCTWEAEAQFFASRGYAVFQPNHRGASINQWKFPPHSEWAYRGMHDDVTDGVRSLVKSGRVDGSRVAIVGERFGGFLVLCGVAFEPGLYRCAVPISGTFDWKRMYEESNLSRFDEIRAGELKRHLGPPSANRESYRAISPLAQVNAATAPTLVVGIRSHYNSEVNPDHSWELTRVLKARRARFEEIELGDYDLEAPQKRAELYTRIETFLQKQMATDRR